MRILYLHQYYCPAGGSGNTRSRHFADRWQQKGHEVTVLTSPAYFPEPLRSAALLKPVFEFHSPAGVRVISLNVDYKHEMPFLQRILAFEKFRRRALSYLNPAGKFDIVYASSSPLQVGWAGRSFAIKHKASLVYECVDVWPDVPEGMGLIRNPILLNWLHRKTNRVYEAAKAIITLSPGMSQQVLMHGPWQTKTHVVFNGTETDRFPFHDRQRITGPVRILYLGTIGKANDVGQLILAMRHPELQGSNVVLDIVGDGNDAARVREMSANIPGIHFYGKVPKEQADTFLAQADIGVVTFAPYPVLEANSANKWFDYLSSGLPVVTNYCGWQAKYMEDWGCGLACPQGDVEALAIALARLAGDPERRHKMGKQGATLARKCFDRDMMADQALEIMTSIPST